MIFVLLAALAVGVVCYFGMDALGAEAIEHWYLSDDAIAARNPTAAHDAMYLHLVYNRNMIAEGAQEQSK